MQVGIVNYELVANTSNRFLVGLILPDRGPACRRSTRSVTYIVFS